MRPLDAGTATAIGIDVAGATVQSATGNVLLQGTGGTDSGGEQFGILIDNGGAPGPNDGRQRDGHGRGHRYGLFGGRQ